MPGYITSRGCKCLLRYITNQDPPNMHGDIWFGLSLGVANRDGTIIEPRAPSYMRPRFWNGVFWDIDSGEMINTMPIVFPHPRENWGTVKSVFVIIGGFVFAMADVDQRKGDQQISIREGELRLTLKA